MADVRAKRTLVRMLLNPPFNRPFAELRACSNTQLLALADVERGEGGAMKVPAPAPAGVSVKELHRRRCMYLGIVDPKKIAKLWEQERELLEKQQGEGRRPGQRRRNRPPKSKP